MKTICAMRDVFKAMGNFETAFEKMYQITLNEAMILCALKEASEKVTATNLSKCFIYYQRDIIFKQHIKEKFI